MSIPNWRPEQSSGLLEADFCTVPDPPHGGMSGSASRSKISGRGIDHTPTEITLSARHLL